MTKQNERQARITRFKHIGYQRYIINNGITINIIKIAIIIL